MNPFRHTLGTGRGSGGRASVQVPSLLIYRNRYPYAALGKPTRILLRYEHQATEQALDNRTWHPGSWKSGAAANVTTVQVQVQVLIRHG